MCTCVQKERFKKPGKPGYFDYVFQCKNSAGSTKIITIESTNDSQAKQFAEEECKKRS